MLLIATSSTAGLVGRAGRGEFAPGSRSESKRDGMKISELFTGIEFDTESDSGASLRGLVPSGVLEEVLLASPSPEGWLRMARTHAGMVTLAVRRQSKRQGRRIVVLEARELKAVQAGAKARAEGLWLWSLTRRQPIQRRNSAGRLTLDTAKRTRCLF